ncbi:uncharacterized protein LOC131949752 [Physella acuta]|uniref:uncharacterized protein LOC131949752 n=1 Tax=Physella acuta TaxID=109671 RepID=UPI0027DD6615|nr:uncharacterized protein LOC131949752 [Physella acuta]XP_059167616.1 uncharacterized protein LOC131949752 [Physella acuta]
MNSSCNTEDRNGFEDINSTQEQVDFNSMDVYPPGSDVTVFYTLGSRVSATPNDWIGIFLNGFRDTRHPLTFQWTTKASDTITTLERKATFSNKLIQPLESVTLKYQFAYINKKNEVLGLSRPFMIKYKESWDLDMELYETVPKGDCSLDGPLALSDSSSGTSESPVLLSIDDDWELANDSPCNKHASLSDLSDIVVLSTSPSKESAKTEAKSEALIKDDTVEHAAKNFAPTCLKRKPTLPFSPTRAEGSLSENVSVEKEMQVTEASQEKAEIDKEFCDKQSISDGNKGIKTEGLAQICTNTKRDRRKKSKKKPEEIVCIEHNPSSFVDRLKLLGDESMSEEESSETYNLSQDRKILIEVINGGESDCCKSKVSQAKQNKRCKKRKNKNVLESSQQVRENYGANTADTECMENDKKSHHWLHKTMSTDHSNRLKKSHDCNVSETDVRSETTRTSRKNKSRKTETVETLSKHNAEIIDEISIGKKICLKTEQGNPRKKKDIQKGRKSDQELKENLIETDVEKVTVVHIPGEELKALKKKYCRSSKTKRNKQQHIRKKTDVFCNLQNLFAEISIEGETPVLQSQEDCPHVEEMSSSLLKDVSDQGFPALPSQHNTPPELVKSNSQMVPSIRTDITAPEENNKGNSQNIARGLAFSSSPDRPAYIPAYLLDIMDALPPPRGNNDVKDLKECDNMLLHKTSKSVLQAFKAKYKVKSARKSELQKMKLRSKYFHTKSGIVDRIQNQFLDPNCNLQNKDNTWKFFQEPEECLTADVLMDGPQTALVPPCQGSTSEVKPALVPSCQGSTSEVKPALVPSCQGSTSEVKPALVPSCQGSISEVKPALVPSCQGSTSEVKPALVPSCQGSTSEVKPALVPSCQGSTSEVKPALVPSCQGSTSEVKPALVPSCQGSTSEVKPALVPSCQGSTSEVKPALVPSSQGSTSEVKPALVPSCQGSTSEVKPALVPSCQGSTSEVKPALVPSCQGSTSEVKPALVPSCQGSTSEVKRTSYANVVKRKTQDTKELVGTKVQLQPNDSASTCASSYVNGKAKRVSVVQNNNRTRSTALRTLAKLLRKRARNLRENKICVQNEIFCQEKNINDHTITPQDIGLKHSEQIGDLTYTSTAERREICNVECTAERREICNVESTAERREICNVESTAERREICNVESTAERREICNVECTAERREICNVESTAERREICNVESTAERREICNVESTAERREMYRTKDTAGLKKSTFGETKEKDAVLLFRPVVRTPTKKAFHSCRSPPKREIETNKDTKRQTEEISWEKAVETTVSPVTMWSTRSPLKDKVESVAVEEMRRVKGNNIRSNEEHVILKRRVAICKWAGQVKSLVRSNTEIVCLRSQVKESNQEIISLQNQVNSLKEALSIETKRLAKANMKWLKLKIKYKELKARKIEDGNKEADKLGSVKNAANISSDTTDLFKSPPRKRKWSLEDPSGYGYSQAPSICIKDELNSPPRKRRRSDNFLSGNPYVKENTSLIEMEPEEANRVYASYNLLSESSTPKHYNFFCQGQSCRQEAVGVKLAQILNPPKYVSQTRASFNGASSHLDSYSHYCVQSKTSPPHLPLSNLSQAGLPKTSPPHLPLFNLSQAGLPKSSPPHLPLPFPNQTTCHVSPLHPVYPNAIYPQSFFPPQEAQKDEKSQFSQATHQYRLNYRNPLLAQNTCMGSPRENCASPSRKQRYTSRSPSYRGVSESVLAFNHMASSYHPRPTCSTTNDATPYQHCHNPHVLQHPLGQSVSPAPTCGHPVTAVHDARLCWNPKSQVAASDPTSAAYLTVYAQEGTSNMKEGTARDDDEYYRLRADASEKPSEKNQVSNNLVLLASGPNTANKCNLYPVRHVYQLSHPTYQSTKHSDNSSPDRQHQVERMFEGKPEIATAKLHHSDVFFQSHFLKQLVKDENMNHVYNAKQIQNSSMQPQAAKMLPFNQCFSGDDNVELAENEFRGSISESFCRKQKLFYQDGEQKYWNDQNGYVPFAGMTENCLAEGIDERKVQSRTEMLNRSNKQKPALAQACKHAGTAFENSMPVLELSANGTIGFPGEVLSSSFCHHKAMMCETCHHKNMMCGACTPILENNQVNLVNLENRPIEASGACHRAF